MSSCSHAATDAVGDAVACRACGQILVENAAWWSGERVRDEEGAAGPVSLVRTRPASTLQQFARSLIAATALPPAYEAKVALLVDAYRQQRAQRHLGRAGRQITVAALYLLLRADHIPVSLGTLAAGAQLTAHQCGVYVRDLLAVEPRLAATAQPADFVDKFVSMLVEALEAAGYRLSGRERAVQLAATATLLIQRFLQLVPAHQHTSSHSHEATALAASWLALDAALPDADALQAAIARVLERLMSVAPRTVRERRALILATLLEHAARRMPACFPASLSRAARTARLLSLLPDLL